MYRDGSPVLIQTCLVCCYHLFLTVDFSKQNDDDDDEDQVVEQSRIQAVDGPSVE